jgi:hypothetical protein
MTPAMTKRMGGRWFSQIGGLHCTLDRALDRLRICMMPALNATARVN